MMRFHSRCVASLCHSSSRQPMTRVGRDARRRCWSIRSVTSWQFDVGRFRAGGSCASLSAPTPGDGAEAGDASTTIFVRIDPTPELRTRTKVARRTFRTCGAEISCRRDCREPGERKSRLHNDDTRLCAALLALRRCHSATCRRIHCAFRTATAAMDE